MLSNSCYISELLITRSVDNVKKYSHTYKRAVRYMASLLLIEQARETHSIEGLSCITKQAEILIVTQTGVM